jgi:hypothetical protein
MYVCEFEEDRNLVLERLSVVPYDSPYILFWYLEGPACDRGRRVSDPYMSLRADADNKRFGR